jgi:hypothetical protein
MWLLGRLAPDHKTIADFRKDNGLALRRVCARFVELCREMGLLATASVAIDGSKFKLSTTAKVAAAFIKHGHLKTITVVNPVNRCPTVVVPAEEVERFARKYISLFALAKQQGRHFRAVKKELDAAGIAPLSPCSTSRSGMMAASRAATFDFLGFGGTGADVMSERPQAVEKQKTRRHWACAYLG